MSSNFHQNGKIIVSMLKTLKHLKVHILEADFLLGSLHAIIRLPLACTLFLKKASMFSFNYKFASTLLQACAITNPLIHIVCTYRKVCYSCI